MTSAEYSSGGPSGIRTLQAIRPIIYETYGKGSMTDALAAHLAEKIDEYDGSNRERMIFIACWHWFSGGDTAASVAAKIEAAL